MRVMGLRVDIRVFQLSAIVFAALWSTWLMAGCGSAASTTPTEVGAAETPTASQAAARPTVERTSTPLPTIVSSVGECVLEPNAQCPGLDLHGQDIGEVMYSYKTGIRHAADLEGANFKGANFEGTNLFGVDLTASNLSDANLKSANLEGAFLFQADLSGADLTNANLKYADTDETKFEGAIFCNTTMPDGGINNANC